MAKGIEVSNNESEFIISALKEGLRLDGRSFDQFRDLQFKLGEEYGYVEVSLGKSKIAVQISSEIVTPYEDRPFEGIFQINTEISAMAMASFDNHRYDDSEILISRLIEKAIRRSMALDLESLCIVAGVKCWSILANVHYLEMDGNLIDLTCIGVMAALLHYKKPDVSIEGEKITVHPVNERNPVPLGILHVPVCVTFSFFNPDDAEENVKGESNSEITVIDANLQEELLRDGEFTITLNKNREIVQISKAGGLSIDALTLMDCCHKAYNITEVITDQIKELIKKDEEKRNRFANMLSAENDR